MQLLFAMKFSRRGETNVLLFTQDVRRTSMDEDQLQEATRVTKLNDYTMERNHGLLVYGFKKKKNCFTRNKTKEVNT